jgi:hypothetical protein
MDILTMYREACCQSYRRPHHNRARLREVATRLKQTDGESWAVGEALEGICLLLDFHDDRHPEGSA